MKNLKRLLIVFLIVIFVPLISYGLYICVLTLIEYKPADIEEAETVHNEQLLTETDKVYTILSWNIGYAGLDENDDFFMDGGKGVNTNTAEEIDQNLEGIRTIIKEINPDFAFFQEVDKCSDRSCRRDEVESITDCFDDISHTFANNYKVPFVAYPIPPIGKVDSGILSLSRFNIENSTRVSLPCPFEWPLRLGNLKRCILVSRMKVGDTGKELVLVNLHLEAYDSGEGKVAQTAILKSYLENEVSKGNYVIAGGDFNQTFSNVDISAYPEIEGNWQAGKIEVGDFEDNFQLCMANNNPTCRSLISPYAGSNVDEFQYYVIDGFLVSHNIQIEDIQNLNYNFKYADHNPVVLKFRISE